jgi:K+-transporting ATPase ATPase C chain
MLTKTMQQIQSAIRFVIIISIIAGILYPALITAIAQIFFPNQANGNLIEHQGKIVGSIFIGQHFTANKYFWSRPSATQPIPYNAAVSGGSNLGPDSKILLDQIQQRINALNKANHLGSMIIPIDLVTASASGLDPHISIPAALYQVPRVAASRNITAASIQQIISDLSSKHDWAVFGIKRVNVLELNLALDQLGSKRK